MLIWTTWTDDYKSYTCNNLCGNLTLFIKVRPPKNTLLEHLLMKILDGISIKVVCTNYGSNANLEVFFNKSNCKVSYL